MGSLVGVNGRGMDENGLARGLVGVGNWELGLVVDRLLRVADGKQGLGVNRMVGVGMLYHRLRDGLRLSEDGLGLRVDGATADRLHVAKLGLSASPGLRDALAHEGALVALGEPIHELPDRVVVAFGVRVLVDPNGNINQWLVL